MQRSAKKKLPPSKVAFVVFAVLMTLVSGMTCWWLTFDGRLRVRLLPTAGDMESYPMPAASMDRG
jgi:hypothetical protein